MPILHNIFWKTEAQREPPNSFYGATVMLYQNQIRHYKKIKLHINIHYEHTHKKIFTKILVNSTKQDIKRITYHDQVEFIPGMQGWFNIHKSM